MKMTSYTSRNRLSDIQNKIIIHFEFEEGFHIPVSSRN